MTSPEIDLQFEALLNYLKRSRGFDFTGYKRSSLSRRVQKRMQAIDIDQYDEYLDYLQVRPEEFLPLFNTLLINVTTFFRDRPFWDFLSSEILPRIIAQKESNEPIRIWSAGCASGEEAYSLAMALADLLGVEQFQQRVKIYATDVDEEALYHARQATYQAGEVADVPPDFLATYFEPVEVSSKEDEVSRYTFRKDLRRAVIFGRHDLIQDAPISKVDLLVCRNTLMYFNAETQAKILMRFHFALRDGGYLFLGKAEMLLNNATIFTLVDLRCRVFAKIAQAMTRDRMVLINPNGGDAITTPLSNRVRLQEAAFDNSPLARIVVDLNGNLALASERARSLFNITPRHIGHPFQDIEISYRPVELRSCIEAVYSDQPVVSVRDVTWHQPNGESVHLDIQVAVLTDAAGDRLGASISFIDMTRYKRMQEELEHSNQAVEMAYEELQTTNEELETTNEELQSTNEELETTNEELQSTNEELETMNEELQSTNEELQTVNDEPQRRSEDLNQTNYSLESILASLKSGVVVLDRDLRVQIWNHKTEDYWGVSAHETIGQHFLNLDIGLPVEQLRLCIRNCLQGISDPANEVTLTAVDRRGRSLQCQVSCTPLMGDEQDVQGVILLMEAQPK